MITPALLFPSISLLMISYTTRFLHLPKPSAEFTRPKSECSRARRSSADQERSQEDTANPQHAGNRYQQPSTVRDLHVFTLRRAGAYRPILHSQFGSNARRLTFFKSRWSWSALDIWPGLGPAIKEIKMLAQ